MALLVPKTTLYTTVTVVAMPVVAHVVLPIRHYSVPMGSVTGIKAPNYTVATG